MAVQADLFSDDSLVNRRLTAGELVEAIGSFEWNGRTTEVADHRTRIANLAVPILRNEFWTSRQRMAHSLHEISYRACFKPQLPEFFISRLTERGGAVYDPFMGRGTTVLQAGLMGRVPLGCDINPLSSVLTLPRLTPPRLRDVWARLNQLNLSWSGQLSDDLLVFYHPDTLREICSLRQYLATRLEDGELDATDEWIRMVAVNRLTGHSPGFFSVYTLPPNQALSVESQRKINFERGQVPPRRDVRRLIVEKSKSLLSDVDDTVRLQLSFARKAGRFETNNAAGNFWPSETVDLVVTSPPFLDVVDYAGDNWLRCWFCGIDVSSVQIALVRRLEEWKVFIGQVFAQLARLLKPGGFVAFEVGEVRGGRVCLEDAVLPCGAAAGLTPVCILINAQSFTKTANIWGVSNNRKGTNTNRVLVFCKQPQL